MCHPNRILSDKISKIHSLFSLFNELLVDRKFITNVFQIIFVILCCIARNTLRNTKLLKFAIKTHLIKDKFYRVNEYCEKPCNIRVTSKRKLEIICFARSC